MQNDPQELQTNQMEDRLQQIRDRKKRAKKRRRIIAAISLIAFCTLAILLRWSIFRVRDIAVKGIETVPYDDVIRTVRIGGLRVGANMPSIDPERVKAAVEDDYRIVYRDLILDYHNRTALLVVSERKSMAIIELYGALYMISEDGYVMDAYTGDPNELHMPKVTGLNVQSARPGQRLINASAALSALRVLLYELERQNMLDTVTEINVNDTNDIRMYTQEGRTIIIGDSTDLMRKINSARTAIHTLWSISTAGGETVNVSNPEAVTVQFGN